jgi:hypothetical protein
MTSGAATGPKDDAVADSDTSPGAHKVLSGPVYSRFIWDVLERKAARNYLEVGVHNGSTISDVACPAIGVDPAFALDRNPVGKKRVLTLFQMTSDEFFRDHDPRTVFGAPVDVAFLDGLHIFEYLLRDFINTERVCDRNSLILLDDCLPITIEMTERYHQPEKRQDKRTARWWTGDVWKVVSILREYRPDLRITPVDVQPTGSILVANLDPGSTLLYDRYFEIVDRFRDLAFTPESFDEYWTVNAPRPAAELTSSFDLSLQIRP